MKRARGSKVLLAVALITGVSHAQEPDAAELLRDVYGKAGVSAGRTLDAIRVTGTATWDGMEGTSTATEEYAEPLCSRRVLRSEAFGEFVAGCDGTLVWEQDNFGITVRSGWDACETMRRGALRRWVPWQDLYVSAELVGRAKIGEQDCWQLELVPKALLDGAGEGDPPHDEWFVDENRHLIRLISRGVGNDGEATEVVTDLGEWREVDGILLPHESSLRISGFILRARYETYELNPSIQSGSFEPSDDVREAAAAGTHRGAAAPNEGAIMQEEQQERHIAAIRVQCDRGDLQKQLATILPEAMHHVMSTGARMTGPPLVRYYQFGDTLDIEAAIPVAAPIAGAGRVQPEKLPAGPALVFWHVGPYEELGRAHTRVQEHLETEGLKPGGACWEEYWTDPGMEPDTAKWRTKVVWPLAAGS